MVFDRFDNTLYILSDMRACVARARVRVYIRKFYEDKQEEGGAHAKSKLEKKRHNSSEEREEFLKTWRELDENESGLSGNRGRGRELQRAKIK